ncbi:MAG: phosphoribosyltransferase family protein [Acidilobaceae archaeon]|nr:phosphoribosyltransferase family protein [Acidilobaceae archaeon]MCX8165339.1 phosphoribosyltransferase family protein [Acidilobaceae archaeon]MDW7973765.1 phosphoribosyltransferase family protein [Sulfolobales archaeon]
MRRLTKAERLKYRLLAVDSLRAIRKVMSYSYKQLASQTQIDETLLARYASGSTVPSYEVARRLIESMRRSLDLRAAVGLGKESKLIDLTPLLSDPSTLKLLGLEFFERFKEEEITKILVPEASGITLATALSLLFDAPLVIARRNKENPTVEYLEEHHVEPPSARIIFYVPKSSLQRGDRVLIVDDIVQSGLTLSVMEKIVERAGAQVVGTAAVVAVGDAWKKRVKTEVVALLVL